MGGGVDEAERVDGLQQEAGVRQCARRAKVPTRLARQQKRGIAEGFAFSIPNNDLSHKQ